MHRALYAIATLSLLLNMAAAWQAYQSHALVDAHCRKLDRYACAMRPTVVSFALEPQAAPAADPIADLIKEAAAHGLPQPPRNN